jgi:hypothetical protein
LLYWHIYLSYNCVLRINHYIGESPAAARGPPEIGAREIEEDTCPTRGEYGKPSAGGRFQKVQSGDPCGPRGKNLPALLVATLNAPALATTDRRGRNNDQASGDGRPAGRQIDHGRFARNQDADRRAEEGRTEGRLGPWCSTTDKVNSGARMVPLYAARIEDLRPGDLNVALREILGASRIKGPNALYMSATQHVCNATGRTGRQQFITYDLARSIDQELQVGLNRGKINVLGLPSRHQGVVVVWHADGSHGSRPARSKPYDRST